MEEAVVDLREAAAETAETAEAVTESFEEKAQALTDIIESIGEPSPAEPEDPSPAEPEDPSPAEPEDAPKAEPDSDEAE